MTQETTEVRAALTSELLTLPPDHVLNRECSYFYNVKATEPQCSIKIAELMYMLSMTEAPPQSVSYEMTRVYNGMVLTVKEIREKIAEHKQKDGEKYTAENEKKTISLMKKKNCGAVTPFGTIANGESRTAENFTSFSGIFAVDFDEIPPAEFHEIRERLKQDKHIVFLFESITRGRLKAAVLLPQSVTAPREYFSSIESYFIESYGLQIDKTCKDPVRLMFGSYDCEPFVNFDPAPFPMLKSAPPAIFRDDEAVKRVTNALRPVQKLGTFSGVRKVERLVHAIENQGLNIAHEYDDWTESAFSIAHECGEAGRSLFHRISKLSSKYNHAENDAKYTNAMMTHNGTASYGKLDFIAKKHGLKLTTAAERRDLIYEKSDPASFWRIVIDETGQKPDKIKIEYAEFYDFLRSHGFGRVNVRTITPQPILCRITNGIAEEQTPQNIREYVAMWVYNNVPDRLSAGITRNDLIEEIANRTRGGKDTKDSSLLSENHLLTNLTVQHHDPLMCDYDTVRIPYENGVLEITANEMRMTPYNDERIVLKSNVLPRAFKVPTAEEIDRANSDASPFGAFVRALSGYYSNANDECDKRWRTIRNALAYAVHNYVTTENRKMVVFVDDFDYREYGKADGGTGKSLLMLAISHLRAALLIDCKNADFARPMAWQKIKPTTRVVLLDDAVQDFDLRDLYNVITTGPTVEMKYRDPWQFETGAHPRIVMASNYGVRTDSQHSSERRVWHVGIAKYFGRNHEPCDDHRIGRLYENWNAELWYMFDVFFASACQDYLKQDRKAACTPINSEKTRRAKLARDTHPHFIDELESIMKDHGPENRMTSNDGRVRLDYRFPIAETCERISEACGFQIKPRTLNSWVRLYAEYVGEYQGYTFTEVRPSERTRTAAGQIRSTLMVLETGPGK